MKKATNCFSRVAVYCVLPGVFLLFVSCGETKVNTQEINSLTLLQSLSPEERQEVVTNALFSAVLDNQPKKKIDEILAQTDISVLSVNKRGNTVLGTAIWFKMEEMALFLLEKFECENLSHQNAKGESYMYLSALRGYTPLIHRIADKCYENSIWWPDYEFSDLDPETKTGETAIHKALNGTVAQALEYEYQRGAFERLWWTFHKQNTKGETFLHTAVKDGRTNTVEWAVREYCHKGDWEKSDSSWKNIPSAVFRYAWNGFQTYLWNIEQLINTQNTEGETALHLAVRTLNEQNIRWLANCRWMDFFIENQNGDIAFQVFLSSLEPSVSQQAQNIKEVFMFLTHKETLVKKWITNISDTVDHQNIKGDSALHISARLNDPFFYNYLKQFADLKLKNTAGQTPQEIFKTVQNKIKSYGL